jgi:signal transduction histidine kinase
MMKAGTCIGNEDRNPAMKKDAMVLLAGILHNVNNYLQTIVGNASLGINFSPERETNNHFKIILKTADRCGETIKQMMAIMMSEKRNRHAVDIRTIVSEMIEMFTPIADNIVRISYSCEDVPSVYGDESDISQILMNLLFNARDAIESNGEINIWIYCSNRNNKFCDNTQNAEEYVCISVKDNGPGIPEIIQEKIFTDIRTTKKGDTHKGIGLVVSQFLAERNSGWIECVHTSSSGTEFVIYLPAYNNTNLEKRN